MISSSAHSKITCQLKTTRLPGSDNSIQQFCALTQRALYNMLRYIAQIAYYKSGHLCILQQTFHNQIKR